MKAIFIDAGHGKGPAGAPDPGAVGNGHTEREFTVQLSTALVSALMNDPDLMDLEIFPIGVTEELAIADHIREVNDICHAHSFRETDALLLSIHMNSSSDPVANGIEAWVPMKGVGGGFAQAIVASVSNLGVFSIRNPAIKPSNKNRLGRLGILDDTACISCLFECGFITNSTDVLHVIGLSSQIVENLVASIKSYLGIVPKVTPFPDVPANDPAIVEITWAKEKGLIKGSGDGLFHPDAPMTRRQLAIVLYRALHL